MANIATVNPRAKSLGKFLVKSHQTGNERLLLTKLTSRAKVKAKASKWDNFDGTFQEISPKGACVRVLRYFKFSQSLHWNMFIENWNFLLLKGQLLLIIIIFHFITYWFVSLLNYRERESIKFKNFSHWSQTNDKQP